MTEASVHHGRNRTRHVIVFEKQPFWEPELQRQFLNEDVYVRGCRSMSHLQRHVVEAPAAVVLDLDAAPADCLQFLGWLGTHSENTPAIVVASESMAELEWHARELGAVAFLSEFVKGATLARLCRKLLKLLSEAPT